MGVRDRDKVKETEKIHSRRNKKIQADDGRET